MDFDLYEKELEEYKNHGKRAALASLRCILNGSNPYNFFSEGNIDTEIAVDILKKFGIEIDWKSQTYTRNEVNNV